jgi:hypothetical protein
MITFSSLLELIEPSFGTYDVACPRCGPDRKSEGNRRRYERAKGGVRPVAPSRPDSQPGGPRRSAEPNVARRNKARWLWSCRQRIEGTPAETYLRKARSYSGPVPTTLGFLASRGEHPPAMIAAFGKADETAPSNFCISDNAITGVHLTRLASDGRQKAGTQTDKIMIGTPSGSPIVLAAPGDLGGLAIAEGIEDALSVHEATGLGAWAAGAASFMPALAAAVSGWIECVTIMVDNDDAGRSNADALAGRLERRGFRVRLVILK